jgi:predicted nucleotide-binding protein (sugar kinase/HSP70/actin superfamily)
MFNPFVDYSDATIDELTEKKIELQKKLIIINNQQVRNQILGILSQIDLTMMEKNDAKMRKEYEESEDYNDSLSIG